MISNTTGAFAVKTLFRVATEWRLSDQERCQLVGSNQDEVSEWRQKLESGVDIVLDEDTSYRIGLAMGIALRFHAVKVKDTAIYIREPNTHFANRTGLDMMLSKLNDISLYYRWVDSFWN